MFFSTFSAITNDRQDASLNFQMLISKCSIFVNQLGPPMRWASQCFCQNTFLLSIYFKMQLRGFKSEKECSCVLSLSSNIYHQAAEEMWLSSPQPTRWFFSSTVQAQWAMQARWIPHQLNLLHNFSETMILSENKCNSLELIFPQCLTFSFL